MRELNLAALRAKQMVAELSAVQAAKEAAERTAEAARAAARQQRARQLQQPRRGKALLERLQKAEARLQDAHTRTLRDAVRVVEEMQEFDPAFIMVLHNQVLPPPCAVGEATTHPVH